jgi:hypothetical protein
MEEDDDDEKLNISNEDVSLNALDVHIINPPEVKLEPGDAWVVHHVEREVVGIDFLPAPKI